MRRLSLSLFCSFLFFQLFLLPSCSNMGAGSDPVNSEGTFSFLLPPAISPDSGEAEEGEALEGEEAALPAGEEGEGALPIEVAEAVESAPALPIEEVAPPLEEEALAEGGEDAGNEAAAGNEDAGEGAEGDEAADLVPVSRYCLYLVSATGFEKNEVLAPSDEPHLFTVQAGQWKILAIAEDEEGRIIARRELNGVSLSAEEEKAISLDWQNE